MLCLSLAVPFYNRRLTVSVLVRVQHKYCVILSECVELEEDFAFFCILCIGDVLYFLTAFKKYVYRCFIFVTNTTEDNFLCVYQFIGSSLNCVIVDSKP